MTTKLSEPVAASDKMSANLGRIEALSQRLIAALAKKRAPNVALEGPGPELVSKAVGAYWADVMSNPAKLIEQQTSYWAKTLEHYMEAQKALADGRFQAPEDEGPKDRRFANPLWQTHPYFNFVKQQYLNNVAAVAGVVQGLEGLSAFDRRRVEYFTRQITDLMAPTNFLATNPDALEKAVETEGESLVAGLENLVRDLEANEGDLLVTLADPDAFRVGENLATTDGAVVFRNRLFELIQYRATTKKVRATPIVIFPPWINKYYILDLRPENSLIKWIVDQGFTLFVVSWKNPDASYAAVGMEDYVKDGFLSAIAEVKAITGANKVNAVGYCIAGTTLALSLSLMKQIDDKSVNSATFFTTLTDFSDPGEVGVFLDDDFVDGIEAQVAIDGVMDRYFMARTFSYLRANDLIYTPAIKTYMMGETPPAFDLLYWNGDGTNLPGRMAVEYLRGLCQSDGLAKGQFKILGHRVSLKDIKVPLCAIACETDHIAPWRSAFTGVRRMGSKDKTFILAQSGHVAGIISPPSRVKYGHYTNDAPMESSTTWKDSAAFHPESWWPRWGQWLADRSGKMVAARELGDKKHPVLCNAPGTYVTQAPND